MKRMNKKGFTLIELLAVILILGIIALIAIPTVNSVILDARKGAWKATANQVINSYTQYNQLCDMRPACTKVTVFVPSDSEDATTGKDGNSADGDTVKAVLEMSGDMPSEFETLKLSSDGEVYIAFKEDGVACWNYGVNTKYPETLGAAVVDGTEIFDVVCDKESVALAGSSDSE